MTGTGAAKRHKWAFRARFRARAFGWRSQAAVTRVREAVAEIKKAAKSDPLLGAEGAVLFLERVSPAIAQVDSSSGSMGSAVNRAIDALVPILIAAPADEPSRDRWMERLWQAYVDDDMPYIERLADSWGELCASPQRASAWADRLVEPLRVSWADHRPGRYFKGTEACLSSLLAAGRHDELLALVDRAPFVWWHHRKYGVRALAALGRVDEAIEYAARSLGLNDHPGSMAQLCERILLEAGRADEAYERFALSAPSETTNLAIFRALAKKYPARQPEQILADLIASTPGDEGKWFATAKHLKLYHLAGSLARRSPCSPKTLNRAARDHLDSNPEFAADCAIASLHWLAAGYGYEIDSRDVSLAWQYAHEASAGRPNEAEVHGAACRIVAGADSFVQKILGHSAGLEGNGGGG